MPLIIKIGTTHESIHEITVTRRGKDYSQDPDSVHEYTMRCDGLEIATFKHRYGDGALVLAALATALAAPAQEHSEKARESLTDRVAAACATQRRPPDPDSLPQPSGRRRPSAETYPIYEED